MRKARTVCIFGGYRAEPGERDYELALALGREVAAQGWTVLNGGYGGTMEASARGAKENGGRVVGVTVELWPARANASTDETHGTKDLWERIRYMLDRSDAFIALPGSTGTLAEIGMAWEHVYKKLIPPKPILFLGDFWLPLYDLVAATAGGKPTCGGIVRTAATPQEAVDFLRSLWRE